MTVEGKALREVLRKQRLERKMREREEKKKQIALVKAAKARAEGKALEEGVGEDWRRSSSSTGAGPLRPCPGPARRRGRELHLFLARHGRGDSHRSRLPGQVGDRGERAEAGDLAAFAAVGGGEGADRGAGGEGGEKARIERRREKKNKRRLEGPRRRRRRTPRLRRSWGEAAGVAALKDADMSKDSSASDSSQRKGGEERDGRLRRGLRRGRPG